MPTPLPVSHAHRHLSNPRVLAALRAMVARMVKPKHVKDCVQRAACAALAAKDPPEDEGAFLGYLHGIVVKDVPRYMASLRREPLVENEVAEETLEAAPSYLDEQMSAEAMAAEVSTAEQEETKRWLAEIAAGGSVQDIALRTGLPANTVWKRLHRAKKWMGPFAILFALFGGAWAAWEYQHREDIVADQNTQDQNVLEARTLRGRATASCNANDWASCESLLDSAKRLDPAGEESPSVKALRKHIADLRALQQMQPVPSAPDQPPAPLKPPMPR
jgi:DNA-directed RNA polymerase specialized sigma24 family protein